MTDTDTTQVLDHPGEPPRRSWRVLAVVLAVLLVASGGTVFVLTRGGEDEFGSVSELDRDATVRKPGSAPTPADRRPSVRPGDVVETDRNGRAQIDYWEGSLTRLGPDTVFEIEELIVGPRRELKARLDVGSTWHRVQELASTQDRFQIRTPNAVATVRGTLFFIACLELFEALEVDCTFAVEDGALWVENEDGELEILTAGECTTQIPGGEFGPCRYSPDELRRLIEEVRDGKQAEAPPSPTPEVTEAPPPAGGSSGSSGSSQEPQTGPTPAAGPGPAATPSDEDEDEDEDDNDEEDASPPPSDEPTDDPPVDVDNAAYETPLGPIAMLVGLASLPFIVRRRRRGPGGGWPRRR